MWVCNWGLLCFSQEPSNDNVCKKSFTRERVFEAASQGDVSLLDGLLHYLQVKGKRLTSPEFTGEEAENSAPCGDITQRSPMTLFSFRGGNGCCNVLEGSEGGLLTGERSRTDLLT